MTRLLRIAVALAGLLVSPVLAEDATQAPPPPDPNQYSSSELINEGHKFFGDVSQGLATLVERAVSTYGQPNGYVIGQEAAGAIIGGARYGEGVLYTKNAGQHKVYWQGPSVGFDLGGPDHTDTLWHAHRLVVAVNLLGLPALAVPAGVDGDGLPVGVQLIAGRYRESLCLEAGELIEEALGSITPMDPRTHR